MFFDSMDLFSKTCFIVASISSILFAFKLIAMFAGFEHPDINLDHPALDHPDISHTDSDPSFTLLSINSLLVFFMGFGWLGFLLRDHLKLTLLMTIIISLAFGLLMMVLMAYLLMQTKRLNHSSSYNLLDCVNNTGKAYTDLRPGEIGQVQIVVSGRMQIVNAINKSNQVINAFSDVLVIDTDMENENLLVIKMEENGSDQ